LRDKVVSHTEKDWSVYVDLLRQAPALQELLAQFIGTEVAEPRRCQLAIIFPEGRPDDEHFESREDSRPQLDYHIDGRGKIPNDFTLLVGIALNDQPRSCCSWGGLTVFPGSHRHSTLHRIYPSQKRGDLQERIDLGEGRQLRLAQGDVVIGHSLLAHRPSENWSEVVRCMAYFRLKPMHRQEDWQEGLLKDPFVNLPGVTRAVAAADGTARHESQDCSTADADDDRTVQVFTSAA